MSDPTSTPVTYELDDDVAVVRIDDGKVNALSDEVVTDLRAAFAQAEGEARAVALLGREGKLSAGFHLPTMTSGVEPMRQLVAAGGEMLVQIYTHPAPVVVGCPGHALAAGALLLLAGDTRIGAEGDFRIGLNEVQIGMQLPVFAVELARDRLSKRHFTSATMQARIYAPAEAVDAGYLDRVVSAEEVESAVLAESSRLAELRTGAYAETKERDRSATATLITETLAADVAALAAGPTN